MTESFKYTISGVPDIDQKWSGLPNGGAKYCVPASSLNWLHYIAQHGRPAAAFPWSATNLQMELLLLGAQMETDPQSGTSLDDGVEGLQDWLDLVGVPAVVWGFSVSEDGDDIPFDALRSLVTFGGLVCLMMGRYTKIGSVYQRISGHSLTMTGLARAGDQFQLTFHDPNAPASNTTTQSAVRDDTTDLHPWTASLDGDVASVLRMGMTTDYYRFVDGYAVILPAFVLTNKTANIVVQYSTDFSGSKLDPKEFRAPFSAAIADMALDPVRPLATVISATGEIWTLDLPTGAWTKFAVEPGASRITVGSAGRIYAAAEAGTIAAFDRHGRLAAKTKTPTAIADIAYDLRERRLITVASDAQTFAALSPRLDPLGTTTGLAVAGPGRLKLNVDHRDSTLILARERTPAVATMRWNASGATARGESELRPGAASRARRRGDRMMPAIVDGRLATFTRDGVRVHGNPLDGVEAGLLTEVAATAVSADRGRSSLPARRNGNR